MDFYISIKHDTKSLLGNSIGSLIGHNAVSLGLYKSNTDNVIYYNLHKRGCIIAQHNSLMCGQSKIFLHQ